MRRHLASLALIFAALTGGAATSVAAQDNPVVVELFTSQGCSSCPPADALLAELGGRDDVIPLALHVDYWDYIGWKDRFAMPGFTTRQKGYAMAGGWRKIYTPQMVINGSHAVVGSRPMKVVDLIRKHQAQKPKVALDIRRSGNQLSIKATALHDGRPCEIHVIRYAPSKDVEITRGENAGHRLTYTHIVEDWDVAAKWNGRGTYEGTVRLGGSGPVVVLVQEPGYGPIVAAARLR
ncbi:DUF1223 domain-containing protein [Thalassococcus lentus]|uniref:DUF1223 domain-containing protein n=1 Tax=Thalassococcus lentus TaxID=1210524 RepID=A0ABT4XRE1_9RHOB|nr:DUF1223 domain-containing protein [Thalassococcus lentus]MDA7424522.1 DUF1223 domain-containing protein [Thalassococcus lentus]